MNLRRRIRELNKGDGKYWHEAIEKENFDCASSNSDQTLKACRCSRSKCLKGYCDCFNAGRYCNEFCKCLGCCNKCDNHTSTKSKSHFFSLLNVLRTKLLQVEKLR